MATAEATRIKYHELLDVEVERNELKQQLAKSHLEWQATEKGEGH